MSEKSQVALPKKSLPWLKRLKGALDDDDSSDSCSLSTDVTPQKVKKEEPKTGRVKKKRPLQPKSESSDDVSSEGSDDKKEKKRRLVKKPVIRRRKQAKDEGSRVESSIATDSAAKASKGKRVGKLRASRATNDRNEKISAIKQKRQQPAKDLKVPKSRLRESRAAQKASAVDADVEDEGEPRRQRKMRPVAAKEGIKRKRKIGTSTKADSKTDPVGSHTRAIDKAPDLKPDEKCDVVPAVVTMDVNVDVKHNDDKTKVISPAKLEVEDASEVTTPAKDTKRKRSTTTSTKVDSKTEPADSPTRDKLSDSKLDEKCDVVPAVVTKDVDDDLQRHEGDKTKVTSPARTEVKVEEDTSVATGNAPTETAKSECGTKPSVVTKETSEVSVKIDTSEKIIEERTAQGKPEDSELSNRISTIDSADPSKSDPAQPVKESTAGLVKAEADEEGQVNPVKTESLRETELLETTPISRKSPDGEESAAPPSSSKIVQAEEGQAKLPTPTTEADNKTEEELLENVPIPRKTKAEEEVLDNMPIPRKAKEGGLSAPSPSAPSFVIPKRTFAKTDVGFKATGQAGRAVPRSSPFKHALDPPGAVRVPPQPSPQSSPTAEFVPPRRKRTKNPVPVKNTPLSPQDRTLMRLSRKRNSIFMAAVELAALSTDTIGNKKRVTGYEVYDVEGKTLSDLIPRLTCATKREMASDRESFAASFFGVSCLAPKAKGDSSSSVVDECGTNEAGARKINCYEELRFERPEDRELYQRKMYGTTFVPQNVRGRITLIVRNARFERKSTGIRFNQDRDREEFAAAMSKRYTFKKSVPRCDIPRENWQRLMRNQPGTVYLHYYNREDAERASQIFRDDDGQLLQIRLELKAGARIKTSYSSASGSRPEHTPRRSCSSERSALEPSPLSSQHGSARNTPLWRRDRPSASRSDRNSRYDRGAPPPSARWQRGEDRYGPTVSGNKRLRERRSRSRSRPESCQRQRDDSYGRAGSETGSFIKPPGADRVDGSNVNDVNDDTTSSPPQKRSRMAPLSPRRSPTSDQDSRGGEKIEGGPGVHDTGEKKSNSELALSSPVGHSDGGDGRKELQRGRSPPRRWQQEPHNASPRPRRGSFSDNSRNRQTESAQYRSSQQQPNRNSSTQRPRSRSRPRTHSPGRRGRGGNYGDGYQERRGPRDYGRGGSYDNNGRMHDRGRGGYNSRGGGANSRLRQ